MSITPLELAQIEARLARNRRQPESGVSGEQSERETGSTGLQAQIIQFCESQWPKWVYDFPRTDQRSTLPMGRHDATIFGPHPRVYLVEVKSKTGKVRPEQAQWAARLKALGWEVFIVRSLQEFLNAVNEKGKL